MSPLLSLRRVTAGYSGLTVLREMDLSLHEEELLVVAGPSGCGKSTLLRVACGLLQPQGGEVHFCDAPVQGPPPGMGVVFQQYAQSLFPWLTVAGNIRLALLHAALPKDALEERVAQVLELVRMSHAAHQLPGALSGGMAQRVAIARALAVRPAMLALDEPFGALDAVTRRVLQDELLALPRRPAMLFISHDVDEALYLADRVVVLRRDGPPVELRPGLPRPRHQLHTPALPAYQAARVELMRLLGEGS